MATRGLIIMVEKNKATAVYNHLDSNPKWLGSRLIHLVSKVFDGVKDKNAAAKSLKRIVLNWDSLKWPINLETLENNVGIDYLLHEWVYTIDIEKEKLSCYKTVWIEDSSIPFQERDKHKGTVIKAFEMNFKNTTSFKTLKKLEKKAKEEAIRMVEN